ncbi:MAG: response regulator transcription factor [Chloroflexi bacterium]|nr:response regulator transcription factor [Chloroflexota bacterium]OJV96592.1 MAG: DNA-binding response regulator [Chloroflexi bacterium 54-19]
MPETASPEKSEVATRITVLLADDHTVLRQGIRALLETQPDMAVVGEATNGREAVELARKLHPAVILMDISMPILNGLEATRQIKKELPECQVVVLTMHENEEYLVNILQAGATGYVLKQAADRELIEAVRIASRGDTYLYPRIARLLVADYLRRVETGVPDERDAAYDTLTQREREILKLIAQGHTNKEIAELLVLSVKTVENHRYSLMNKLNAHDRGELIKYAIRVGLIQL